MLGIKLIGKSNEISLFVSINNLSCPKNPYLLLIDFPYQMIHALEKLPGGHEIVETEILDLVPVLSWDDRLYTVDLN
jgi:hypothetical protein